MRSRVSTGEHQATSPPMRTPRGGHSHWTHAPHGRGRAGEEWRKNLDGVDPIFMIGTRIGSRVDRSETDSANGRGDSCAGA